MENEISGIKIVDAIPPITRKHKAIYVYLKTLKPGQIVELDYKQLGYDNWQNLYVAIRNQIYKKYLTGIAKHRGDKVYYIALQ